MKLERHYNWNTNGPKPIKKGYNIAYVIVWWLYEDREETSEIFSNWLEDVQGKECGESWNGGVKLSIKWILIQKIHEATFSLGSSIEGIEK